MKQTPQEADEEDASEALNLKHDLDLQRLHANRIILFWSPDLNGAFAGCRMYSEGLVLSSLKVPNIVMNLKLR